MRVGNCNIENYVFMNTKCVEFINYASRGYILIQKNYLESKMTS